MAPGGNSGSGGCQPAGGASSRDWARREQSCRESALLPRWGFAEDAPAIYANAAIDWKQFAGQTIALAGATHPWSNAIAPLLPQFTILTGINVVIDFQLETDVPGRAADQARPRQQRRPTSSCS